MTPCERNTLEQARNIRAELRKKLAEVIYERILDLGALAALVSIVAGALSFFDLIDVISTFVFQLALWTLAATFIAGVVVGLIAGIGEIEGADANSAEG